MSKSNVRLRHRNELFVEVPVPPPPPDHRFYVLFHGLISLVQSPEDEFRAYALNMDREHHYRFGHWLREDRLPSGLRATLHGLSPSPRTPENSLNPALNPTIRLRDWPRDDDPRIRARLSLPRPRRIHYLGLGKAEITHPELLLHPSPTVCGLTVFEYELPGSLDQLEIRDDEGQRHWAASAFTEFKGTEFAGVGCKLATLHIYDAPSRPPGAVAHSLDEFALSTALLGQPGVTFAASPADHAEQPVAPHGLSAFEVAPLTERAQFLRRIASFARTGRFLASQPLSDGSCKSCCSAADGDLG
ncbi:MAG: hypothetical protein K2X03_08265 [Bryobacteraceae bacterium]|nr:hypothetical protein [Bryobacteraceae bacterium]